jgi:putative Mg2+ transporter-C (MgtC) family protein
MSGLMQELSTAFETFRLLPHAAALAFAYLLALPIGWNRERTTRSAGLRTFPLVAVAACGFVQTSETFASGSPEALARVLEGLITGVGFIGGGAILRHGASVHGTATAASVWATGAIGGAVGFGAHDVAVTISLFTFLTLLVLGYGKDRLREHDGQADQRATPDA